MKLKSKIAILLISILSLTILFTGCGTSTDDGLQEVRLNEVVRSVFYAPMYISISQGFFEDEGLKIDLSTGQGADKVMQNVLSNNADIGFCGPEQTIYINNQGRENYPVIFAQLTQKDGSFLVGRKEELNFTWESLKNKKIIGGRPGGVPEMALEYVLKDHKLSPTSDVDMVTNIDFTATAGAFKSGTADYVALFEPTASMLEQEGNSHIVASIGESLVILLIHVSSQQNPIWMKTQKLSVPSLKQFIKVNNGLRLILVKKLQPPLNLSFLVLIKKS